MKKYYSFLIGLFCLIAFNASSQTLFEDFEGGTFPPTGWDTVSNGNGLGQQWKYTTSTPYAGSQSAFVRYENVSSGLAEDWLISPLTAITANDSLVFWHKQAFGSDFGGNYYIRVATTTQRDTANFTTIKSYTESDFGTSYESDTIDLSAYAGQSIYIAFVMENDDADNWFLDNVQVGFPSCLEPNALGSQNVTADSALLFWTEAGTATEWQVEWGASGFTAGSGTFDSIVSVDTFLNVKNLMAETGYDFYVRAICAVGDTSSWSAMGSFTTPCAAVGDDYTEDFSSYVPDCWEEAKGQLATTTVFTSTTSSFWNVDGFLNNGTTGAARMNIYSTNRFEWLISPSLDLGTVDDYQIKFDVGLTDFSGSGTDNMGADDILAVVISTDNGATWSIDDTLQVYRTANQPANAGETVTLNLGAYTGNVKVGFYAESTSSNTDYNVYVDNFLLEVIPTCLKVTDVATNGTATSTSAEIGWTANTAETQWGVEYGTTGFTLGTGTVDNNVTTNPFNLTGLTIGTTYDVYVRGICGAMDTSKYAPVYSFLFAGAPLSGVYTIDSATATGGSNYQSFTDFVSDLNAAGVSGPVTVNVVSGSGPYNQQVIFGSYAGASSANAITINGNGNTIEYSASSADKRIVGFDGATHITLDSLTIKSISTLYGYGVHLMNDADSNTIQNCTIDLSSITSTSSTNSTGILASGSITSTSTDGSNASYTTVDNNTIMGAAGGGAYYGIYFNGDGSGSNGVENNITNNNIENTYSYSIYLDDQGDATISGNDMSRMDRTAVTTGAGVFYNSGSSENNLIEKNRIHDLNTGDASPSASIYGIYHSSNDATAGNANRVQNNIIYNFNGTSTHYGLYNSSSNYVEYYHNTISLDDASSTSGTTRGIYITSSPTNVDVRNNIVNITRGGSTAKYGIYFSSTSTTFICDYNNVNMNSAGSGNQSYGYFGSDQATLANWQAANGGVYGANSSDIDPGLTSATDLTPTGFSADNSGVDLSVADDINGVARTATPDMGAIEFTGPSCPNPTALAHGNPTGTTIDVSWTENGSAISWQIESGASGFTQGNGMRAVVANDTTTLTGLTVGNSYDFYVRAICGSMDTSVWSSVYTFTFSGAPLTGTYTIDSNTVTGGTNFQSFADFTDAIGGSGISGAIIVNVVSGSGPYNEQVIFPSYPGGSATDNVTINGNGETIAFDPPSTDRRIVGFDGAKHIILDSMTIESSGTTYGYGIHFMNSADSNTIQNCIIDLTTITSTSSANSTGILSSGSVTSTSTDGTNASGLTIDNNTVMGGALGGPYYGIYLNGGGSGADGVGNDITNNTVANTYSSLIYLDDQSDAVISGNDLHRMDRTSVSTGYGIFYNSGSSHNNLIEKNRIHDLNRGDATPTAFTVGIYHSSNDATAGNANRVQNNIIYNFNGTGTQYGLYNSSSNYVEYYHNTVSLDDASSTSGTTRGIFITSSPTNVDVQNNIVNVTRGGSTAKYGIYFSSSSTTFTCDYNDVNVNSAGTGPQHYGYYSGDQTTLTDWQAANTGTYGANSTDTDPLFASSTDLTPGSLGPDGTGVDLSVADDINGVARTATPDMGAIEFTPPSCIKPAGLLAFDTGSDSTKVSWVEPLAATQWEVTWDTTGFTLGMGRFDSIVNNDTFMVLPNLMGNTTYDFYVRSICAVGDTSGWSPILTFTTACPTFSVFPFTETFNSDSETEACWTFINANTDADAWEPNNTGNTFEGDQVLSFNSWNNAGANDDYAITPALAMTGNQRIRYYTRAISTTLPNDFNILVSTTGTNTADFTDTVYRDTTGSLVYEERIVDLDAYTGDIYVAFHIPNGGLPGDRLYIDDITFEKIPSCFRVLNPTVDTIAQTFADVSWSDSTTASQWQVEWDTAGFMEGTGRFDSIVNTDTFVRLPNLMQNTEYEYYIRAICSVGDTASWVGGSFRTTCDPMTIPYTETFNSDSPTEACWTFINANTDADAWEPNNTGNTYEGNQVLSFNSWNNAGANDDYAITPAITLTGNERIRYFTRAISATLPNDFEILVSTTGNQIGDFRDTVFRDTTGSLTYEERIVNLNAYTGDVFVAFHIPNGGLPGDRLYIDNIIFETLPSCFRVLDLAASTITDSSALISWEDTTATTSWELEWDTVGYNLGDATNSMIVSDTFFTITGLTAGTSYEYAVRAVCGPADSSAWVGKNSFRTEFSIPRDIVCNTGFRQTVLTEEFDNSTSFSGTINSGNGSWQFDNNTTSSGIGASTPQSGTHYIYTETSTSGRLAPSGLVSPAIDLTSVNDFAELSFWFHAFGADIGTFTVGVGTSATGPFTEVFEQIGQVQTSTSDPWTNVGINLDAYVGQTIYLEFFHDFGPSFRGDLGLDLVEVYTCVNCTAPSNLSMTEVKNITAQANWQESGFADRWQVEWDTAGFAAGDARNSRVVSNDTFTTITGLNSLTNYDVYVRAICTATDTSDWSDTLSFTTAACQPVTGIMANNLTTNSTDLVWTENSIANQWEVQFDTVGYAPGAARNKFIVNVNPTLAISGLNAGNSYDVYIRAICAIGDTSSYSTLFTLTTPACADPTALAADESSNQAELSWTENSTATQWQLEWDTAGFTLGSGTNFLVNTAAETLITGLRAESTYEYYVRSICGNGDTSSYSSVGTISTTICDSVINLMSSISSVNANVWWTEQGTAVEWEVEYGLSGFTPGTGMTMVVADTFTVIPNLMENSDYDWYVRAICAPGDTSVYSEAASVRSLSLTTACSYTLQLEDAGNNGWTGNTIDVKVGNTTTNYTLSTGSESLINLDVDLGDSIVLNYLKGGTFSTQVSFTLWNAQNLVVYSSGLDPAVGVGYADTARCPSCVVPSNLGLVSISADTAIVNWMDNAAAPEYEIEWDLSGFTLGMGDSSKIVSDTAAELRGLGSLLSYDFYVRAICGAGDTSEWTFAATFQSDFVCPANAECVTYTAGNVSSDYLFRTVNDTSRCPGTLSIAVPAGNKVDSISTTYDMTSPSNRFAWISEQRSWMYSPLARAGEDDVTPGVGDMSGTYRYERTGLTFANKIQNTLEVEMNAGRALNFGPNNCGDDYVRVDDNTWSLIVYYSAAPSCSEPLFPEELSIGEDNAVISWLDYNSAPEFVVEWDVAGFTAGTGANSKVVSTDTFTTLTGLIGYTQYDYYIRAVCTPGTDSSVWSVKGTFLSACATPTALSTSSIGENGATLSWMRNGVSSQWEVQYDAAGFVAGAGTNSVVVSNDTFTTVSGLDSYTNYDFYVRSICGMGDTSAWSMMSSFITDCGTPTAPTNNGTGVDTANISFTEAGMSTSWEVEYDTSGYTAGSGRNSVVVSSTTTTLSSLMASTEYDFYVRAICAMGDSSSWSAAGSFTTRCVAPTALTANSVGEDTASVSWTENGTATEWDVEYDTAGYVAGTGRNMVTVNTTAMTTLTGLASATGYDFYVRAVCDVPNTKSFWSAAGTFTTDCGTPTALMSSNVAENSADVSWTESGSAMEWEVEYDVTGFTAGSGTNSMIATTASASLSGLLTNTQYDFYVRAICSAGDTSSWSMVSTFTTNACATVSGLTTSNISLDTADVSWTANSSATMWEVSFGPTDFTAGTGTEVVVLSNSYTLIGLTSGTDYDWYVRAICRAGDTSVWSDTASFTTGICETVTNLAANNASTDTVDLSWTANSSATMWEVSYGATDFTAGMGTQVVVSSNPYTLSGLNSNTSYDWYVRAICKVGDTSDWSDTSSFTTAVPYYPIATINTEDATGVADSLNVYCWTSGIVMGVDLDGNAGLSFYITDLASGTQEGMNVFNFNDVSNYVVTEGDSIRVRGPIIQFNGLTEINVDSIEIVSTGNALPAPMVVTTLDETTEAKLIELNNLTVTTASGSGSYNMAAAIGTDTLTIRVDFDTDVNDSLDIAPLNVGDTICSLVGIGAQFDNTAPRTEGYQIFPMRFSDIDTTSCLPVPTPYYPIATINTEDATGVADSLNVYCWTSGIVMGVDLDGNAGLSFYITDLASGTQEGMNVFNFNDVSNYVVTEGDSIRVRGPIIQFNGLTEINVDSIEVISTGNTLPAPMVVTTLDETTEAKLIQINNLVVTTASGSGSYNMAAAIGLDTLTIRVDFDTDVNDSLDIAPLNVGDTICSMVGIGAQFDNTAPRTEGYQIFPMRFSDIDTSSCQTVGIETVEGLASSFSIAPNPTDGDFILKTSGFNNSTVQLVIRDLNGRIIVDEFINKANAAFQKTFDFNDNAKGIYFISIFDGENVINEKLILQ